MMQQRILILDGIPNVLLGVEFYQALKSLFNDAHYLCQKDFNAKMFYGIRRSFSKKISKKHSAYVYPFLPVSEVKEKLEAIKPTIVVVIGFSHHLISKEDLNNLKQQLGFQLVLWDTDSANYGQTTQAFSEFVEDELMRYDKVFSFSSAVVRYMNRLNRVPFEYLHFGAPAFHVQRTHLAEKNIDLLFAGIPHVRRLFLLSAIEEERLCIIGERWKRIKSILPEKIKMSCTYKECFGEELYETMHRAKIIVNISNCYFYGIHSGLTLRFFETLALKGFLLTDNIEEASHLFVPGKEIELFSSSEEFVDKVAFYSKHDEARNKIAAAGYEKFINHYTWAHQAKKLLNLLGVA